MKGKKILVGITGGIAAYKTCSLVNLFLKEGAEVKVVMTDAATKFVGPITFQALTNNPVYVDMFKIINQQEVEHISLAKWADIAVISPATANTISKISLGLADNLLTTVLMAFPQKKKIVFVPAMNTGMWENPIFQENFNKLKKYSARFFFVEPKEGILACRDRGRGKISSNEEILTAVKEIFEKNEQ